VFQKDGKVLALGSLELPRKKGTMGTPSSFKHLEREVLLGTDSLRRKKNGVASQNPVDAHE